MKALIPSKIAEIIFALCVGYFGVSHFLNGDKMAGMIPDYLPGEGKIWVYIAGTALVLAAVAIITGIQKSLACNLLAVELLIFVFAIHLKPFLDGNAAGLLKDTSMAMCAILIANRGSKN